MKDNTKALLTDLLNCIVNYTDVPRFNEAIESLGFEDFSSRMRGVLMWQKNIFNDLLVTELFYKEKMIIGNIEKQDYEKIFSNCEDLNQLFELNDNQINYNSELSEEDKVEIQSIVNAGYHPRLRINRSGWNRKDK